ncbi:MAG: hypothetical protein ABSB35_04095, partial [Bryobacteraceae bacterium]
MSLFRFASAAEEKRMCVRPRFYMLVCLLPAMNGLAQTDPRERVVESVVPSLDYNSSCWSAVEIQNLG